MTTLVKGADAAFPGQPLPDGAVVVGGYIGHSGPDGPDAVHLWTPDEWNLYAEIPGVVLLPIYVHDYPGDGSADADNAADAAEALGWGAGIGRAIVLDTELLVDQSYVLSFAARLDYRGFRTLPYGSAFYVTQNPPCSGRWVANYTSRPPGQLPAGAIGVQWRPGGAWDLDVFDERIIAMCGVGARHGGTS